MEGANDMVTDNVAEAKYGTICWDAYVPCLSEPSSKAYQICISLIRKMSKRNGDGEITWGRQFLSLHSGSTVN